MKHLISCIITSLITLSSPANTDSLWNVFEASSGLKKTQTAFRLGESWYAQRNDSALYFLDYVINNNDGQDTLKGYALKLKGNLYLMKRSYAEAANLYAQSLEIFEKANHIKGIEEVLNNLGIVMIRLNKFDNAINYGKQSLIYTQQRGDEFSAAKTMHNIAYIYEKKNDYETALEYYVKALQIKRQFDDSSTVASTLNNIGNIYVASYEYDIAIKHYEQSLIISRYLHDSTAIALRYYNLGRVHNKKHDFEKSMEYFQAALAIYIKTNDQPNIARIYNSLGSLFSIWRKNKKAIEYYSQALQILNMQNDIAEIARVNNNIAECYEALKQYKKAKVHYETAINSFSQTDLQFDNLITNQNYSLFLIKTQQFDQANKHINKSFDIAFKLQDKLQIARTYQISAELFYEKNLFSAAIKTLNKSYANAIHTNDLKLFSIIYLSYYKNHKKLKNYKKALYFKEKQIAINDSIFKQESYAAMEELEQKFKIKEKEKEITLLIAKNQLQESENNTQRIRIEKITQTRNLAILGLMLFMLLLMTAIYAIYSKIRANNKLKLLNAEINEKKEEILTQRDEIESQMNYIENQNKILTNQKTKITDSINYARYIQSSILPNDEFFAHNFSQYMILYKPKDIVSGDIYFGETTQESLFVAVIDCTGHGVPGAFMSILAYNALKTTIVDKKIHNPSLILDQLDIQMKEATHSSAEIAGSGMDMVLVKIDKNTGIATIAGAKLDVVISRNGELNEIKATKRSIGGIRRKNHKIFANTEWALQKNDILYIYTDGYGDQFGGEKHKKFKSQNLKKLLHESQSKELSMQKNILNEKLENWKGNSEQIDDILVLAIKI